MELWQIFLKNHDKKICTASGKTVLSALYKFIGLLFLKGLFCENDFYNLGKRFASEYLGGKK